MESPEARGGEEPAKCSFAGMLRARNLLERECWVPREMPECIAQDPCLDTDAVRLLARDLLDATRGRPVRDVYKALSKILETAAGQGLGAEDLQRRMKVGAVNAQHLFPMFGDDRNVLLTCSFLMELLAQAVDLQRGTDHRAG